MKRIAWIVALGLSTPLVALADSWKDAHFVDAGCAAKMKSDTDKHTRECALKCSDTGYGIVLDGKFIKFDEAGNKKTIEALNQSKKTNHLRVDVSGTREGDLIKVASVVIK